MDYKKWVEKVIFAFMHTVRNSNPWCNASKNFGSEERKLIIFMSFDKNKCKSKSK